MRARQKLILDALVIKKEGEASMLASADDADDADGDGMAALSAAQLWTMLSHGAEQVFDPTADARPPTTAEDYDALLDAARPTSLQDEVEDAGEADDDRGIDRRIAEVVQELKDRADARAGKRGRMSSEEKAKEDSLKALLVRLESGEAEEAAEEKAAAEEELPTRRGAECSVPSHDESGGTTSDAGQRQPVPSKASPEVVDLASDKEEDDEDDEGGEEEEVVAEWKPLATTRDHAELLAALHAYMAAHRLSKKAARQHLDVQESRFRGWLNQGLGLEMTSHLDARVAAYLADPVGVAEASAAREAAREAAAAAAIAKAAAARGAGRRATAAPKRFTPPVSLHNHRERKVKLCHDEECFSCADGGDLIECTVCPRVYHLECVGLVDVPTGAWHCPWHTCVECERKSSNVGGQLFHCMTCPLTYCFDCAPDAYTSGSAVRTSGAAAMAALLERRGVQSTKSYLFFHCDECKDEARPLPAHPAGRASAAPATGTASSDESEGGARSEEDDGSSESGDEWIQPAPILQPKKAKEAAAKEAAAKATAAKEVEMPTASEELGEERRRAMAGERTALVAQLRRYMRLKGLSTSAVAELIDTGKNGMGWYLNGGDTSGGVVPQTEAKKADVDAKVAVLLGLRAPSPPPPAPMPLPSGFSFSDAARTSGGPPGTAAPAVDLRPGDLCEISGLVNSPELNGLMGTVASHDPKKNRYHVAVHAEGEATSRLVSLHPSKLQLQECGVPPAAAGNGNGSTKAKREPSAHSSGRLFGCGGCSRSLPKECYSKSQFGGGSNKKCGLCQRSHSAPSCVSAREACVQFLAGAGEGTCVPAPSASASASATLSPSACASTAAAASAPAAAPGGHVHSVQSPGGQPSAATAPTLPSSGTKRVREAPEALDKLATELSAKGGDAEMLRGWTACVEEKNGRQDAYYIAPEGKRFRSRADAMRRLLPSATTVPAPTEPAPSVLPPATTPMVPLVASHQQHAAHSTGGSSSHLSGKKRAQPRPQAPAEGNSSTKPKKEPSAYNLFLQAELTRVKQAQPGIEHKLAFSMAATAWASSPLNPKTGKAARPAPAESPPRERVVIDLDSD